MQNYDVTNYNYHASSGSSQQFFLNSFIEAHTQESDNK